MSKKPGLYANINAKRERGEKMRKPGEEGAPSAQDFKNAAKTAKKKKGAKRQDPGRMMYDKDGCKMCKGGKKPCRCGKADMGRKGPYADGCGYSKDSVAEEFNSILTNDAERSDKPCGNSYIPQNAKCNKGAGQAKKSEKSKVGNIGARAKQGATAGSKAGAVMGALAGGYIGAAKGGVAGALKGAAVGAAGGGAYGAYVGASQGAGYAVGEKIGKRIQKNRARVSKSMKTQKQLRAQYNKAYHTGKANNLSRKKMQELDMKYAMKFARAADRR